jgi:hypothetical protein
MPVKEVMSSRTRFRGITFAGGTQRSADRPTLWCSNQEDVSAPLWHYVAQDRQTDNQYWSNLLGLPASEIGSAAVPVPQQASGATKNFSLWQTALGCRVTLPTGGQYAATLTDHAGRTVYQTNGTGRDFFLPDLETGPYLLKVRQSGRTFRRSVFMM